MFLLFLIISLSLPMISLALKNSIVQKNTNMAVSIFQLLFTD